MGFFVWVQSWSDIAEFKPLYYFTVLDIFLGSIGY